MQLFQSKRSQSEPFACALVQLEAAQVHCELAMATINSHECALRDDDQRAAMHKQWIATKLAGLPLDAGTQLYADMILLYDATQKKQARLKAEQEVGPTLFTHTVFAMEHTLSVFGTTSPSKLSLQVCLCLLVADCTLIYDWCMMPL